MSTDPRSDSLVRVPWDALSERLRAACRALPGRAGGAIREVVELHVAWDLITQSFDESGYVADFSSGVGCRSCKHSPDLVKYPEATPWCTTMEELRLWLVAGSGSGSGSGSEVEPVGPVLADKRAAWYEGYRASASNREALEAWRNAGGSTVSSGPEFVFCPYERAGACRD